jgi:hypothetical protein
VGVSASAGATESCDCECADSQYWFSATVSVSLLTVDDGMLWARA